MTRKSMMGSLATLLVVGLIAAALVSLSAPGRSPVGYFRSLFSGVDTKSTLQLDTGRMEVKYLSGPNRLSLTYSAKKEDHQLRFSTKTRQMGVLIEVKGTRLTYSVRVLGDKAVWPPAKLKEISYPRRLNLYFPGWKVIVVEKEVEPPGSSGGKSRGSTS